MMPASLSELPLPSGQLAVSNQAGSVGTLVINAGGKLVWTEAAQTTNYVLEIGNRGLVFTTSQPGSHVTDGFDPLHDVVTLDQGRFGSYAAIQSYETQ